MKFLKSSVLFISMACIVPVCSIAREKSERITRAEIEQKSADEFINGLMSRMTVDEKIGQLNLPSYGNVMPDPKKSEMPVVLYEERLVVYLIYSVSMRSGSYKKSRLKKVDWGFL